jgi:hypothetical protein
MRWFILLHLIFVYYRGRGARLQLAEFADQNARVTSALNSEAGMGGVAEGRASPSALKTRRPSAR